jgi:DNA polymerase-3 subunit delta'
MSFQDIYGHEKQIDLLLSAVAQGRVPHAFLFSGMSGIGKKTVAMALAKRLNCLQAAGRTDACGHCPSCLKIEHGNHPDLVFLEPEGQFIRIKAIRDLQAQMQFRPLEGNYRLIIIDEADRMHITAANALLKTLEEPAPGNLLILVTGNPAALPRTILSRCQQVRYSPLEREDLMAYLKKRHGLPDADASIIAAASGGSAARAVEMVKEDYRGLRDRTLEDLMAILDHNLVKMLSFAADFGKERDDIMQKLDILRNFYRDALVYRETGRMDALVNHDRGDLIADIAKRRDRADLMTHLRAVGAALSAIEQNANKALTLEAMMFKLAHQRRQEA